MKARTKRHLFIGLILVYVRGADNSRAGERNKPGGPARSSVPNPSWKMRKTLVAFGLLAALSIPAKAQDYEAICLATDALYRELFTAIVTMPEPVVYLDANTFTEPFRTLFSHLFGNQVPFDMPTFEAQFNPDRKACGDKLRLIEQLINLLQDIGTPTKFPLPSIGRNIAATQIG